MIERGHILPMRIRVAKQNTEPITVGLGAEKDYKVE